MTPKRLPAPRTVSLVAAAWVLALGFDFLLHGGLLAPLYAGESPFLLPPETAFARIPAGYLAFLLLAAGLLWLFRRLDVRGWRKGARTGLVVGDVVEGFGVLWHQASPFSRGSRAARYRAT